MRHRIALLDRLASGLVATGLIMATSGAFTLTFQASGIGFIGQSVLALTLGAAMTVWGFRLTARARAIETDQRVLYRPTHNAHHGQDHRGASGPGPLLFPAPPLTFPASGALSPRR